MVQFAPEIRQRLPVRRVGPEQFRDVLPLLRRTFAEFEPGVRRSVGELVRRGPAATRRPATGSDPGLPGFGPELDQARTAAALQTVRLLLGTTTTTDLAMTTTPEPEPPHKSRP